ncbi:MAG: hypothetical protein VCA38_08915 [Roseibacillus sp.]
MRLITALLICASSALVMAQVPVSTGSHRSASASAEERETFITSMKGRLTINTRQRDPFGLPQDLTKAASNRLTSLRRTRAKLPEVLSTLNISGIGSNHTFLVGPREIGEGQIFRVIHRQETFRIRVLRVSLDSVIFQDADSGETLTRQIQLDPRIRTKRSNARFPDGVVEDSPEGPPLHLD